MKKIVKSFVVASLLTSLSLFAYNPLDGVKAQKMEALEYVKKFISPSELKTWIKDGKKFQLIDGGIKAWIKSGGDINNSLYLGTVKIKLNK